jgi:predicted RNase H-like nuclease
VVLFGLPTILKYKKKRQGWPAARAEFGRYLRLMRALRGPGIEFAPELLRSLSVRGAVGRAYKAREDRLDAVFCAYLAALVPAGRMELLGVPEEGSIAVPSARSTRPHADSRRSPPERANGGRAR